MTDADILTSFKPKSSISTVQHALTDEMSSGALIDNELPIGSLGPDAAAHPKSSKSIDNSNELELGKLIIPIYIYLL